MARIKASILEAKARGSSLRVGSELELCPILFSPASPEPYDNRQYQSTDEIQICGYGCLDHFLENDFYTNSWYMLLDVLEDEACHGILLDIGMPVSHGKQCFNW